MAVTFLAMLELMKRREIVVTQEVPWGPIVARATTPDERGIDGAARADEPIDESLESFS
jgi:chromatin segregation and condensation protein Rec8/ScpA/Scc1 (kleisin family)